MNIHRVGQRIPQRNDPCPAPLPVVGAFTHGGPRDSRRPQGISDWLLWQNVTGSCVVRHAHGEKLTGQGDIVLIAPRTPHDYGTPPRSKRWDVRWVVFAPPMQWAELLRWPTEAPGIAVLRPTTAVGQHIGSSIDTAWQIAAGLVNGREALALNAVEAALLWAKSAMHAPLIGDPRARQIAEEVMAHLARPTSLSGAARRAGLSSAQFARCFRATYGSGFAVWVEGRRIARAQELLRHSDLPIATLAQQVGYPDPFHFSASFRRRCGLSPRQFRQQCHSRDIPPNPH